MVAAHQSGEALRLPSLPTMYSACLGRVRVRVRVRVRIRVRVRVRARGLAVRDLLDQAVGAVVPDAHHAEARVLADGRVRKGRERLALGEQVELACARGHGAAA